MAKPAVSKRKIGDVDIRDSPYFKIRALVSLLRPRFLQVLETPDFHKCEAATDIEQGMKLVMEYYREMLTEAKKRDKMDKAPLQFESAKQSQGRQKATHQAKQVTKEADDKKLFAPPSSPKMTYESGGRLYGSYIVGGSLTGWNYITFKNRKQPQYYGVTKETHRSNRHKP
ncbi:hypothetical protein ACET3Z_010490 [Daucus carota]